MSETFNTTDPILAIDRALHGSFARCDRPPTAAIRAVLAANADDEVLQRYDADLDAAFERARTQGDLTPLVQTVRRWWFEADAWRDPNAQREFLARVERYQREGPPPPEERISWQELRTRYGL